MVVIESSVGAGGVNKKKDVKIVQILLNSQAKAEKLITDGLCGSKTIGEIFSYQRTIMPGWKPDGRVDPNGRTFRELLMYVPKEEKEKLSSSLIVRNKNVEIESRNKLSTTDYSVSYKSSLPSDKRLVSSYSINVIRLALAQAGMKCAVISSTLRFPEEQASIMYRNARIDLKKQKQLYGKNGDAVLDVYSINSKKNKHEVIRLMKEKIELLARDGKKVSKHCTTVEDYKKYNVIDIGVNSTRAANSEFFSVKKFTAVLKALTEDGYINKFIDETGKSNKCWHIEVVPNAKKITRFD
ncbi:hypothetical protein ACSTLL_00755 [Vibrio parahaemolyticus]